MSTIVIRKKYYKFIDNPETSIFNTKLPSEYSCRFFKMLELIKLEHKLMDSLISGKRKVNMNPSPDHCLKSWII